MSEQRGRSQAVMEEVQTGDDGNGQDKGLTWQAQAA